MKRDSGKLAVTAGIKLVRTPEISNVRAVIAENTVEDGLTLRVILTGVVGAIIQWSKT